MRTRMAFVTVGFMLAGAPALGAEEFSGMVIAVVDGDLVSVIRGDVAEPIHLFGIDCPEREQPFGPEANQLVANLVLGKEVTVELVDPAQQARPASLSVRLRELAALSESALESVDMEKTGTRLYGNVTLADGTQLNQKVVEVGLAWWYRKLAPGDRLLKRLNADAMKARKGLWADPAPVAPWDFRRFKEAEEGKAGEATEPTSTEAGEEPEAASGEGVFITKQGRCYHKYGCRYLDKTQRVMARGQAQERGYSPCPVCFPDALAGEEAREVKLKGQHPDVERPRMPVAPTTPRPRAPTAPKRPPRPKKPSAPKFDPSRGMELMARHRPRTYRDAGGSAAGVTADDISQIPFAPVVGLQDGDVIQGINSVPIRSIEEVYGLVERFKNEKHFDITILRNGRSVTRHFALP